MPVNDYICLNGAYLKSSVPSLLNNNRGFRYSDAVVESIHAYSTEPQFLSRHLDRLSINMKVMQMPVPGYFTRDNFRQLIVHLLNKNKLFKGALIRLTVFRKEGEEPVPEINEVSFLLESIPLGSGKYVLNTTGLKVDLCNTFTKTTGPLSFVREAHSMLYMLSGMECKSRFLDSLILLNEAGRITETCDSNIFLISGNGLFTPGIKQGCIPGIMRSVVLELAEKENFRINDNSNLSPAALDDAEEVFLTNARDGIRWVAAYREKRYFNKTAKMLTSRLNDWAFDEV